MARSLKRFLVSTSLKNQAVSDTILLTPEETHHLKDVLRLKEGALCLLFDRDGFEFISRVERFLPDACSRAQLLEPAVRNAGGTLKLTVAQAIPQDRKMDEIVRKSAELGIFKLIPLITERTIVRIEENRFAKVHARWNRIAEQTMKQSKVQKIPQITLLVSFDDLCKTAREYDQSFLFHPSGVSCSIRELSFSRTGEPLSLLVIIGPEGGFTSKEVAKAEAAGIRPVKVDSGILKTDTAFVTIAGFFTLMYA